ncbi:acetyl/propionyl/methylcrotonyl-CoA carboxylase subunit alpha [Aeromicrobium fastidiosum]|uniref:ATP-grasp domain-containing protein n=1 Tax=Aeromicrobium fastidiosum TaxID=52699 RepID=A0A641AU76_9ACTN|nr:biotin carboxylase N-terminal domain-containing protein [Aeromicrobium fastidiosum]KAA1380418.1 ATP-grasp domain-containing protein [Aeromicrobium fastidiosum]MBP2389994.1 acetyl/propionyl-CoA carboxylase alpha subunit [Aeromicrobium fastidiosum]
MTFSSVLVANRGEIARRVILACREAGLRSIAVYSDADADAPYVRLADEAVHLGPTPATESYLSIDRLLAAARASGAEAVHPGYGFLSERAEFARAVVDAGLVFIGPTADVMDAMGRKDRARAIAERAGVPVTAQFPADAVPADAYPVLVKAAAGGGGKGMRIVREASGLAAAVEAAGREAAAAFGDDTLLVEQYVEAGRHVEVQVFGDTAGHVVHLFERDCSVQRRHQKVVEEAPAFGLTDELRRTLHESSVALCREVGYTGAGTVEFLVADDGAGGQRAYFLEMNTRLQVEHPVTEEITGLDLVQWQLLVAAGQPLPLTQDEITATGHAMEVRVYAEDPYAGFVPQAGHVQDVAWPDGARIESDLEGDAVVSTAYDPMLGKIVVAGTDREDARLLLVDALDGTGIFGVTTNLGFVRRLVAGEEFAAGRVHTAWLDSDASAQLLTAPVLTEDAARAAAVMWAGHVVVGGDDPFGRADGWRSGADPAPATIALADDTGRVWRFAVPTGEQGDALAVGTHDSITIAREGQTWTLEVPDPMRGGHQRGASTDADLVSPMPGTVLRVDVAEGDTVVAGQQLGVVEAMKMELAMTAPYDGVVSLVGAVAGDQVPIRHLLFTVDPR